MTNYYVRKDGNDACNGTVDIACASGNGAKQTIQTAVNLAQPGDTVIVHAGTYTNTSPIFTSFRSGTSNSPITIQAAPNETVNISNTKITHNYNIIKGLTIISSYNLYSPGILINASYCQVLNNIIMGNGKPMDTPNGDCTGVSINYGHYNIISHNTFDGQGNGVATSFNRAMYINGTNNECTYNIIKETNSIERVLEIYGHDNRIANNEVKDCDRYGNEIPHPDIFQVFGTAESYNIIIENNYFHDLNMQLGNLGTSGGIKEWTFRNNIFANIANEFFIHMPVNFYNNTFYKCIPGNTGNPINACYDGGVTKVLNNAFIACGYSTYNGWYMCGGNDKDYNFVSHTENGGSKSGFSEAHGVNGGDPKIISPFDNCTTNTCNFHISENSALIGKAQDLSTLFTIDKDGNIRTVPWDIGAYKYITQECPTPIVTFNVNI